MPYSIIHTAWPNTKPERTTIINSTETYAWAQPTPPAVSVLCHEDAAPIGHRRSCQRRCCGALASCQWHTC